MVRQKKILIAKFLSLLIFLCAFFLTNYPLNPIPCTLSYAAVPHLINYQAKLTDSSGVPLNGSYNLTCRIYDAEAAGNLLWQETHSGLVIQKGVFSVLLGSVTNLDLAFDKQYYLAVQVGSDPEMSPRQRISSSGYAIRAETAENANQAQNANAVGNVGVNTTPSPNKLLPLDASAKLPAAALKIYDSGWFQISSSGSWVKTHNLGTTKCIVQFIGAVSSDGSGINYILQPWYDIRPAADIDGMAVSISSTEIKVATLSVGIAVRISDGSEVYIRSLRIIMLALE